MFNVNVSDMLEVQDERSASAINAEAEMAQQAQDQTLTYYKSMAGYVCNELYMTSLRIDRQYGSYGKWQVIYYRQTIATFKTLKAAKAFAQKRYGA